MKCLGATRIALWLISLLFSAGVTASWNNPYPAAEAKANILYSAFRERPKTFDPARAYSSNEYLFIAQIYEPPFQYHYLKRPYTLVPLTAVSVPTPSYLDKQGRRLPPNVPGRKRSPTVCTKSASSPAFTTNRTRPSRAMPRVGICTTR